MFVSPWVGRETIGRPQVIPVQGVATKSYPFTCGVEGDWSGGSCRTAQGRYGESAQVD